MWVPAIIAAVFAFHPHPTQHDADLEKLGRGGTEGRQEEGLPHDDTDALADDDAEHLALDEPDADDIVQDLEEYSNEDDDGSVSRQTPSSIYHAQKPPPTWYTRVKAFLSTKTSKEDLEAYVPNFRYTPILSGIVIPFSILLEIPGLTGHWYIKTIDNKTVETQPNPLVLDVGLAFSMACAVVANACLVARFLEFRVRPMTVTCVVFLTMHDLINIVAVTIFGVEHGTDDGYTYGQSFWMTVCSTIVSTFTNVTLIVDLIRTPDFAKSGSGLTRKQRSLVIIVIVLLCYIALGALVHSILLDLTFVNALYFTTIAIETVGFGDIVPTTTGARIFTCTYSTFGIITLAVTIGLTRETVLEGLEVGYRKRIRAVRERRRITHWKQRVSHRWQAAVEWRLRESDHPIWVPDKPLLQGDSANWWSELMNAITPYQMRAGKAKTLGSVRHPRGMHLNLEALTGPQLEAAALEAGVPLSELLPPAFWKRKAPPKDRDGTISQPPPTSNPPIDGSGDGQPHVTIPIGDPDDMPLTHIRMGKMIAMLGKFALSVDKSNWLNGDAQRRRAAGGEAGGPSGLASASATRAGSGYKKSLTQQYEEVRSGVESEEERAFYARLGVVWILFMIFWMGGSAIFKKTEGWSFGDSMYFCFIAFTTLGYGDFSPKTPAGRSIFVVWALLGIATMTILISVISDAYSSRYKNVFSSHNFQRAVRHYRAKTIAPINSRRRKSTQPYPKSQDSDGKDGDTGPHLDHIAVSLSQERARAQLEGLPRQVLLLAQTFHEQMRYFVGGAGSLDPHTEIPEELTAMLDEIVGAAKPGSRTKTEILQDDDARQTLFTLSIEKALRKMVNAAEEALEALEERDSLVARHRDQQHVGDTEEIEATLLGNGESSSPTRVIQGTT